MVIQPAHVIGEADAMGERLGEIAESPRLSIVMIDLEEDEREPVATSVRPLALAPQDPRELFRGVDSLQSLQPADVR